ncbi:MAG TPA: prepilin peptidase, partial [Candidatus Saccharimonadales bacterium]|nr:prepilin peptidase [Candidatus Saccharimonadales bacterium]
VVDRSVKNESIVFGRSYCDYCHAKLSTFDLVPILSFVGLRARCRYCRHKLSWQYPIVETLVGVLFAATFYFLAASTTFSFVGILYYLAIISTLVVVAVVDLKFSLIPTTFVFGAAILALFRNYFYLSSADFVQAVFGAFVLALFFLAIVLVTRGRGMGTGDIPLVFLLGLFLGWPQSLLSTFLAFVSGAVISIFLLLFGRKKFGQAVPFGPFLIGAAIVVLFWGNTLTNLYLKLLTP